MRTNLAKCFLVAALAISPLGCEPRPVVAPDDDDSTVVEERDTIIERDTDTEPGTGVDVNVGDEPGVDVDVDRDAAQPNQNP